MDSNNSSMHMSSNKVMLAGLLGFALGIMYAPRKGTETQEKLKSKIEDMKSQMMHKKDKLQDKTEELKESGKEMAKSASNRAKSGGSSSNVERAVP